MLSYVSLAFGASKAQDIPNEPNTGNPEDSVVLVALPASGDNCCSGTPFAGKLDLMLRIAGIPFKGFIGSPVNGRIAKKGKLPALVHGSNCVADSTCIVEYMINTYPEKMEIFVPEDPGRRALARALKRMLEEGTYFSVLYLMWQRNDAWQIVHPKALKFVPAPVRPFVRSQFLRDLHGQGTGRHSFDFVKDQFAKDCDACDALLEKNEWLTGPNPTEADAFLFALLELGLSTYTSAREQDVLAVLQIIKERSNLLAFHKRIRTTFYGDQKSWQWRVPYKP